ncbi:MAG TPA: protein-L-isoaspartate O-methyltransferase [Hyphomicrobiaceae bacterium]|nr:protein-L-isoaspartate O-methyltransferase [Hyphomicrobiaceae bacterium]
MADVALQRKNMVESQVRPNDVTDRRILNAMLAIPREAFAPIAMKPIAYMDEALILVKASAGRPERGMMAPRAFAKLLQLAEIGQTDVVLDVGAMTGYSSAVIARIAQTVVTLEGDSALADEATKALDQLGADNAAVVTGELEVGYPSEGPYDAIVIEGSVEQIPAALLDQLKDGGRLVAVEAGVPSHAVVWKRMGRHFDRRVAFEAAAPAVPGFEKKKEFVF